MDAIAEKTEYILNVDVLTSSIQKSAKCDVMEMQVKSNEFFFRALGLSRNVESDTNTFDAAASRCSESYGA
jgi:hypothetical protein